MARKRRDLQITLHSLTAQDSGNLPAAQLGNGLTLTITRLKLMMTLPWSPLVFSYDRSGPPTGKLPFSHFPFASAETQLGLSQANPRESFSSDPC